jgi:hypothetical protein
MWQPVTPLMLRHYRSLLLTLVLVRISGCACVF